MKKATLTVSLSTNPATAHIGPYFADLRVGKRQNTKVGSVAEVRDYIKKAKMSAEAFGIELDITDETLNNEFTAKGGIPD